MSKYFSIDAIMAAFSLLNTKFSIGTHFSALQYMFALDNFNHEHHKDCDTVSDENTFVSLAHKVGRLEDGEVPDHIDGFTGRKPKKDKDSARIHSNFISAGAVPRSERATRKDPELYPSGKKNYLFAISKKVLLADSICYEHLDLYLSSKEVKTAFAVWVERNSVFKDESSFAEALKDALGQSYTDDLINALWKDGVPSPADIGLDDDVFSNVKPCIDWATIEEYFPVGELNSTHSEPDRVNLVRNSPELHEKVAGLSRNLIYFGAPGTGKSHELDKLARDCFAKDNIRRVTFYPDYTYSQFVGSYRPFTKDGQIGYRYIAGPFLQTYLDASLRPNDGYLIIIEELNRANPAAVFGDVFQLLDRNPSGASEYAVSVPMEMSECIAEELDNLDGEAKKAIEDHFDPDLDFRDFRDMMLSHIELPPNMFIWATMNSADQGVFPMDTAFKRRWDFRYMGIDEGENAMPDALDGEKLSERTVATAGRRVVWNELRKAINTLLLDCGVNEDKLLGPFFLSPEALSDEVNESTEKTRFVSAFEDKVLLYLYEDAGKMRRGDIFWSKEATFAAVCEKFEKDGIGVFAQQSKKGKSVFNHVYEGSKSAAEDDEPNQADED